MTVDATTARDIPRHQRRAPAKPIQYYLDQYKDRDAAIFAAVREGQHSMTDIAVAVGLSVSRVSRIARRLEGEAIVKACPYPSKAILLSATTDHI